MIAMIGSIHIVVGMMQAAWLVMAGHGFGKFLLANNTTQSVWKPQDIPKQINDDTPTHPQHPICLDSTASHGPCVSRALPAAQGLADAGF